MSDNEDKRTAVELSVNLSNQLTSSALTLLVIEGAIATYILSNYDSESRLSFISFIGLSFLLFIISIICGGRGIAALAKSGSDGIWDITKGKNFFNSQSLFGLLGLIFLAISVFLSGTPKKINIENSIAKINEHLGTYEERIDSILRNHLFLHNDIQDNRKNIIDLKKDMELRHE